jgi:hypothetical protein
LTRRLSTRPTTALWCWSGARHARADSRLVRLHMTVVLRRPRRGREAPRRI